MFSRLSWAAFGRALGSLEMREVKPTQSLLSSKSYLRLFNYSNMTLKTLAVAPRVSNDDKVASTLYQILIQIP
jgi:hypothetical protein